MIGNTFGDIMATLKKSGYIPEAIEDSGFEPFKGRYIARIDSCGRIRGISKRTGEPYDFVSLQLQIVEVVEGDNAINRYLKRNYNWDNDGIKDLMNDLFTAGLDQCNSNTDEEFEIFLSSLTDKLVKVSAWTWTPERTRDGVDIPIEERKTYQHSKIVKSFRIKGQTDNNKTDKIPF